MRSSGRASRSPRSVSNTFSTACVEAFLRKRIHGLFDLAGSFGPHARPQFIEVRLNLARAADACLASRESGPELCGEEGQRQRHILARARQRVQNFESPRPITPSQCRDQSENRAGLRIGNQRGDIGGGDLARGSGEQPQLFDFHGDARSVAAGGFEQQRQLRQAQLDARFLSQLLSQETRGFRRIRTELDLGWNRCEECFYALDSGFIFALKFVT